MTNPTELAPCPTPWCEDLDDPPYIWQGPQDTYTVICGGCQVEGPYCDTEAEAITAWNTRISHTPAPVEGVVERVAREMLSDELSDDELLAFADCRLTSVRLGQALRAIERALKSSGLDEAIEALERVINVVGNLKSSGKRLSHVVPELGAAVQAARTTLANLRGQQS